MDVTENLKAVDSTARSAVAARARGARGRSRARGSLVASLTMLLLAAAALLAVAPTNAAAGWVARQGNIHAGGFQNVVVVAPPGGPDAGRLLVGGDVSGVQYSDDQGSSWKPGNHFVVGRPQDRPIIYDLKVAALAWSELPGSRNVYSLRGNRQRGQGGAVQGGGSLSRSTDGGETWTFLNRTVAIANAGGDVQTRPTGKLIALDEAGGRLFFPDWDGSVYEFVTTGQPAPPFLLADFAAEGQVTSLVFDKSRTALFAAVSGGAQAGTWRINPDTGAKAELPNLPVEPQEALALTEGGAQVLYVVGGGSGVKGLFRCTGILLAAPVCTNRTGPMSVSPSTWAALDGYHAGGSTTLVVGSTMPMGTSDVFRTPVWRVTNANTTPVYTAGPGVESGVSTRLSGGTGAPEWWLTRALPPAPDPPNHSSPEYGVIPIWWRVSTGDFLLMKRECRCRVRSVSLRRSIGLRLCS